MVGFNTIKRGGIIGSVADLGSIYAGVVNATSLEKKRLDVQAAEARARVATQAADKTASILQNNKLMGMLKFAVVAISGIAMGFVAIKFFKGR